MPESASIRAHAAVPFMNPLSEEAVDRTLAGAALGMPERGRILETGCGTAELLLRALAANPRATGVGVDPDGEALARARAAARERGLDRRLELIEAPAEDAALPAGGFDLVINVASSHAHGGFPAALDALATLAAPRGGQILFGEGFWAREPSPEFLDALGGATVDELPLGLAALEGAIPAVRPRVHHLLTRVASVADWSAYEEGLAAEAARHGDNHAQRYAARIRTRRALPGGTDTLGFALLVLQR